MKILLMAPWGDREIGGLSSHLLSLEKVIALAGHESVLASHESIPKSLQEALWFVAHVWPGSRLRSSTTMIETLHALVALRQAVRGEAKLIHAHEAVCLPGARWVSRFVGAPVILTVHSQYALGELVAGYLKPGTRDAKFAWAVEKSAFENADYVFTVTTRLRSFVLSEANVDPARVMVRLNFVDTAEFKPRPARVAWKILNEAGVSVAAPTEGGSRTVLYSGRLSPRKGVDVLIRAARTVVDRDPDVRFLITGDGPQYAELTKMVKDFGLGRSVTFLGNLDSDLVKYVYNLADVVVLPSVTLGGVEEGTPMSALESMASGVPVLCSPVGGLAEIIVDGETGYHATEGSVERLAERVIEIVGHDQSAVTDRALRYVREHRSLESYAKELTTFLRDKGILADERGLGQVPPSPPIAAAALRVPLVKGRRALSYATTTYREFFRHRQWGIGVASVPIHRFLEPELRPEVRWVHASAGDEYLADPFGVVLDGRLLVLCERYNRATKRGVLIAFDWPAMGDLPEPKAVLPTAGHASYPFLFQHEGHIYCIPETSQAGQVALFRADSFPYTWTKVATLLSDFAGVDNTLLRFDDRFWLFSGAVDAPDRRLHIFHAEHLEGPWTPHPKNPVLDTLASARPAGTPFIWHGDLYRPSQDCSKTYGGRVAMNKVEVLSPDSFQERVVSYIEPDPSGPYPLGLHTLSSAGDVTLLDGFRNVFSRAEFRRRLREGSPRRRARS